MDSTAELSTQVSANEILLTYLQQVNSIVQRRQRIRDHSSESGGIEGLQVVEMSQMNLDAITKQQKIQKSYQLKKKAKEFPISTIDHDVKMCLRQLGQPVCLFGEDAGFRRERLKAQILEYFLKFEKAPEFNQSQFNRQTRKRAANDSEDSFECYDDNNQQTSVFYTEADNQLKEARMSIAKFSLPKSQRRFDQLSKMEPEINKLEEFINGIGPYTVQESQYADDRCVSRGCISPDEEFFATSGWSGVCRVWGIPDCQLRTELKGHTDRVVNIRFHPMCGQINADGPNIATASADSTVKLWSLNPNYEDQKCVTLKGHDDICNSVEFHPMGVHVASGSHDKTWRFWDIEKKKELMQQEGHAGPIYSMSFHQDGSLLATGDLHGVGLIWDLRSGKNILAFPAHSKQLISIVFMPNGYQLATASDDNTVKIWDLRKKSNIQIVPAHTKLVSDIKFESQGRLMLTSSYDNKVKIWSAGHTLDDQGAILLRTLTGHENKVTSVSCTSDLKYILTTSFDRTFKLWRMKQPGEENML